MSGVPSAAIADLVIEGRARAGASSALVWNLNLDQIESATGRVLERVMVSPSQLGPSTYPFEAGTVLYSKLRPYLNKVVVADDAGYATTELVPLRCAPEKIDPVYLAHFLRSPEFLAFANNVVAGAKMPRMVMSEFWKFRIPLPPLPEQRRLAAILDKADALRAKRREALVQLDHLAQSIFVEMFGNPVNGDGRFPVVTVESIAAREKHAIVDGPFGSSLKPDDYRGSGIPVIRIANLTKLGDFTSENLLFIDRDLFEKLKRSSVKPRDVLVSRVGTIGNTCLFPEGLGDALLSTTGVCKITVDESRVLPEFLHRCFLHPAFQEQIHKSSSTSVQKYFNLTALKGWSVVVPPMSEQKEFVERLAALKAIRARLNDSLQRLEALFSSLQFRAFREEI